MALSPVSYIFISAGAAIQAKGALYRFNPSRTGQSPNWDGRNNSITPRELTSPITDKSFWEGRYALCELTFENSKGERLIMNDAIVAISRSKNIVTTQMVGMNGTIKEYINDGDYNLNIVVGVAAVKDGVIVDEYPSEGLRNLRTFLDDNEALNVHSEFLDVFDISSIVISSFSVSQDTASNYQSVSISAISDEEYDIFSTEY